VRYNEAKYGDGDGDLTTDEVINMYKTVFPDSSETWTVEFFE